MRSAPFWVVKLCDVSEDRIAKQISRSKRQAQFILLPTFVGILLELILGPDDGGDVIPKRRVLSKLRYNTIISFDDIEYGLLAVS